MALEEEFDISISDDEAENNYCPGCY